LKSGFWNLELQKVMKHNRREFLVKSSCALSMAALASQAQHFGMMSALAHGADKSARSDAAAPTDYRALVCIFLDGGNDSNNMIVPKHSDANISNYAAYTAVRGPAGLALSQAQLLGINVPRLGNLQYGLHWNMGTMVGRTDIPDGNGSLGGVRNAGIHDLWAAGKLAVVTNVGTLVRPMLRAEYQNNSVTKPYQLYSHSDQQFQMQSSQSASRSYTGWGGRIADFRNAPDNPGALVPMITSITGAQLFTNGQSTRGLAINDAGTALNNIFVLNGYGNDATSIARRTALNEIRALETGTGTPEMIKAASTITEQANQASLAFAVQNEVTVAFPNTDIGRQLKQVARVIKKRTDLNVKRQIFFCRIGGYDTHSGQVPTVTNGQNGLLLRLSQAMRAFYDEMTAQSIQNGVTMFTLSDFGRTFDPAIATDGNGVGSDHAWGSHMLVVGGAVNGGNFYGSLRKDGTGNYFPTLVEGGPDDTDGGGSPRGRWIPTTSVEQYASVLARWYGVTDANELNQVFPNLGNFSAVQSQLGFLPTT
jgi:uncharacterized protein (DUF1501 family)